MEVYEEFYLSLCRYVNIAKWQRYVEMSYQYIPYTSKYKLDFNHINLEEIVELVFFTTASWGQTIKLANLVSGML